MLVLGVAGAGAGLARLQGPVLAPAKTERSRICDTPTRTGERREDIHGSRQPLFDQPFCFKKEAPARGLYPDRLLEDLAVIGPRATFGKVRLD